MTQVTHQKTTLQWLMNRIIAEGVQVCCMGAGSRSTQLVGMLNQLNVTIIPFADERAVGYLALGIIKATKRPVLVVTTSGTAVSNLCPAMTEAKQSYLNLIAMTADRPNVMQGTSANQTINQTGVFHDALAEVHWEDNAMDGELDDAFQTMHQVGGPIHINVHLDDPVGEAPMAIQKIDGVERTVPYRGLPDEIPSMHDARKGVLCIGQLEPWVNLELMWKIMDHMPWPILVDASNAPLKSHPKVIHSVDGFCGRHQASEFDGILYLGGRWVSKNMTMFLNESIHISEGALPIIHLKASHQAAYRGLLNHAFNEHEFDVNHENGINKQALHDVRCAHPTSDMAYISSIFDQIQGPVDCFVSNSLPIRFMDYMAFSQIRQMHVNRGASGIDGNIATVMGLCAIKTEVPLVAIIGDLASVVDLNAFLMMPMVKRPLSIVIINNGGGDIFSLLPSANQQKTFNKQFKLAHDWALADIIKAMGVNAKRVEHPSQLKVQFESQVMECMSSGGAAVIQDYLKKYPGSAFGSGVN